MSDHIIHCDTCGELMYPGSPEHKTHACAKPALARAQALLEGEWTPTQKT